MNKMIVKTGNEKGSETLMCYIYFGMPLINKLLKHYTMIS